MSHHYYIVPILIRADTPEELDEALKKLKETVLKVMLKTEETKDDNSSPPTRHF